MKVLQVIITAKNFDIDILIITILQLNLIQFVPYNQFRSQR